MSLPTTQKAIFLTEKHGAFAVSPAPVPTPGRGQLLVKIHATALNPVDWKIQAYDGFIEKYPTILGSDIAGEVVGLGEGVTGFAKGDRVFVQGAIRDNELCGFQQYALTNAAITGKIPSSLTYEQAATFPLGITTATVGLFNETDKPKSIGLYPPWKEGGRGKYAGIPILIFGGASSVGQYAVQLAKLSGFSPIITTASAHNSEYLTSLGATHVISRTLSGTELAGEIAKITDKPLTVIYDAISSPQTSSDAVDILAPGGALALVNPGVIEATTAKGGKDKRVFFVWGSGHVPENTELIASLVSKIGELVEEGVLKPNQVEVLPNGLEGIIGGLEKLKAGVSNVKLVALPQV